MNALVKAELSRELNRQLNDMELATELVTLVMEEVGSLHRHAAGTVAQTLKEAQRKIKTVSMSGGLTYQKEVEIKRLTQTYLGDILYITHRGSVQMTNLLMDFSQQRR